MRYNTKREAFACACGCADQVTGGAHRTIAGLLWLSPAWEGFICSVDYDMCSDSWRGVVKLCVNLPHWAWCGDSLIAVGYPKRMETSWDARRHCNTCNSLHCRGIHNVKASSAAVVPERKGQQPAIVVGRVARRGQSTRQFRRNAQIQCLNKGAKMKRFHFSWCVPFRILCVPPSRKHTFTPMNSAVLAVPMQRPSLILQIKFNHLNTTSETDQLCANTRS